MHHAFGNYRRLARSQVDRALFQIDQQLTANDIEELVFVLVFMPMIFALDHAEPHDGLVHFAQRLVVPLVRARFDESGHVDRFERAVKNVEPRIIREARGRLIFCHAVALTKPGQLSTAN